MKNLVFILATISLLLVSCNKEQTPELANETPESVLKSFVLSRNVDGTYVVSHDAKEGIATEYKSENEIFLYKDASSNKSNATNNYAVIDNTLNIDFTDENDLKLPSISISDVNSLNKSTQDELLDTYSITYNEDGTVSLSFEVKNGVVVSYEDGEIHLTEGEATETNFTKIYDSETPETLIQFVQTIEEKGVTKLRIPHVIIVD